MNVKTDIKNQNKKLLQWQEAYYNGKPIVSDSVYDVQEAILATMIAQNPQFAPIATALNKVGSAAIAGNRIPHIKPMLSIENFFTEDTFVEAAAQYGAVLLEEPKRDGISCELRYSHGVLTLALTRGDGESGEDMTAQVKALKRVPQSFSRLTVPNLNIRGELVMRNSELVRINAHRFASGEKLYSNTRNLVAGTMKEQDLSIVASRDIFFMPWDLYSPDQDEKLPYSYYERMQLAFSLGFPAYEGQKVHRSKANDIVTILHSILANNEVSDVNADGVVIKVDSYKLRNQLGVSSKFTNYQHCYKMQNQKGITYLREVKWQVGRTGKVTPVGIVDPIVLGGATITNVSLNNQSWIKNLNLKINSKIEIVRSGDVIPMITEVLDE